MNKIEEKFLKKFVENNYTSFYDEIYTFIKYKYKISKSCVNYYYFDYFVYNDILIASDMIKFILSSNNIKKIMKNVKFEDIKNFFINDGNITYFDIFKFCNNSFFRLIKKTIDELSIEYCSNEKKMKEWQIIIIINRLDLINHINIIDRDVQEIIINKYPNKICRIKNKIDNDLKEKYNYLIFPGLIGILNE